MYQSTQLGDLGGRRENYAYATVDYKIAQYMGTATQADTDRLNILAALAAKARAKAKKTGIGGAVRTVMPYALAIGVSIVTAGAASPGAIAWAVGSQAAQDEYIKKKAKKQQKKASKQAALTVAEIKQLEAEAARVKAETDKMIAQSGKPVAAKQAINQAAAQQKRGKQITTAIPWIGAGLVALQVLM